MSEIPRGRCGRLYRRLTVQPVILLFLVTFGVVVALNPAKVGLVLYALSKLALFAWIGRWVDSWVFVDARPEDLSGPAQGTAWKRRAWIVAASILAGALAP